MKVLLFFKQKTALSEEDTPETIAEKIHLIRATLFPESIEA